MSPVELQQLPWQYAGLSARVTTTTVETVVGLPATPPFFACPNVQGMTFFARYPDSGKSIFYLCHLQP